MKRKKKGSLSEITFVRSRFMTGCSDDEYALEVQTENEFIVKCA